MPASPPASSRTRTWILLGVLVSLSAGGAVFYLRTRDRPGPGAGGASPLAAPDSRALLPPMPPIDAIYAKPTPLVTVAAHPGVARALAVAPDGKTLLTGGVDRQVKAWSYPSGAALQSFVGHTGEVAALQFAPDGRTFVSGGDTTLRVWDLTSGAAQRVLAAADESKVTALDLAPGAATVAAAGFSGTARTFSLVDGTLQKKFEHAPGLRLFTVAFDPTGHLLATGGDDALVKLWNVDTGALVATLRGHEKAIDRVLFAPDGKQLLSAGDDGRVRLWSSDGKPLGIVATVTSEAWALDLSPDGDTLAIAGMGSWLRFRRRSEDRARIPLWTTTSGTTQVRFVGDDDTVATTDGNGQLKVFALPGAAERALVPKPPTPVEVALDPGLSADAALAERARRLLNDSEEDSKLIADGEKLARDALAANPKNALALVQLARVLHFRGYLSGDAYDPAAVAAAHVKLDLAEKLQPDLPELWSERAFLFLFARDLPRARAAAEHLRALAPTSHLLPPFDMAVAIRAKDYEGVVRIANEMIAGSLDRRTLGIAYGRLALAYINLGRYEAADAARRAEIEVEPDSAWAKGSYAEYLGDIGRAREAVQWAEKAIAQRDYPRAHFTLARVLARWGVELVWSLDRVEEGCAAFERAVKEREGEALGHYGVGACLWREAVTKKDRDGVEKARAEWTKAAEFDPKLAEAGKALRLEPGW